MAIYKIEEKEDISISFLNLFDLDFGFDLSLYSAFSQIA